MTSTVDGQPRSILVVVPAHNEVETLPACLDALRRARRRSPVPVQIVVVLDRCDDGTESVIPPDISSLTTQSRNVGAARAAGFRTYGQGCGQDVWFVCTDADSVVADSHFEDLLELTTDAHAITGTVRVRDWAGHDEATVREYERMYASAIARGHAHVHGANLAVRADAYWAVGGFSPLAVHEDVDLLRRVSAHGYSVTIATEFCVDTSSRTTTRAADGFGAHLLEIRTRVRTEPQGTPITGARAS